MDLTSKARLAILLVLLLLSTNCSNGKPKAAAALPGNKEISTWKLVEGPTAVETEADFYNLLDGAAPKYLESGWVRAVYAAYQKDGQGSEIRIFMHDMGTAENAENLFKRSLPVMATEISTTSPSDPSGSRPNAVINAGLSSAYASVGFSLRFFLEANIDAKTDTAFADLKEFTLHVIERAH